MPAAMSSGGAKGVVIPKPTPASSSGPTASGNAPQPVGNVNLLVNPPTPTAVGPTVNGIGAPAAGTPPAPSVPTSTPAAPAPVAPAPATVDPRDATYYANLAALTLSNKQTVARLGNDYNVDQASYNSGTGNLTTQLPQTLRNTRNVANSQGLLESGILTQQAGENETQYAQRMGNLLTRWQQQQNAINTNTQNATDNYNLGMSNAMAAAIARAAKNDLATQPTTAVAPVASTGPVAPVTAITGQPVGSATGTLPPVSQNLPPAAVMFGAGPAPNVKTAAKAKATKKDGTANNLLFK